MRTLALALSILIAAAAAAEEDGIDLRPRYAVGDRYAVKATTTLTLEGSAGGETLRKDYRREKSYVETVVAAADGAPRETERVYDVHRVTRVDTVGDGEGESEEEASLVAGRTLALVAREGGVWDETGDLEEDDLVLGSPLDLLLPGRAVAPGEEWAVAKATIEALLGEELERAGGTAALAEVVERDGRRLARITVRLALANPEEGVEAEFSGELLFDLARGKPTTLSLDGKVTMAEPDAPRFEGTFAYRGSVSPLPAK